MARTYCRWGYAYLALAVIGMALGSEVAVIGALFIVAFLAFATSDVLKALGK